MPIRTNPITLSSALSDTLNSHTRISGLMMSIDPHNIGEKDKPALEALNDAAKSYLRGNDELMHEWKGTYDRLANMIEWGSRSDRGLIAALILAGAAIERPDIDALRPDFAPSLLEARQNYQQAIVDQPRLSTRSLPDTLPDLLPMPHPKAFFVTKLAQNYRFVKARMAPNGRLDTAIKTLLEDDTKPLRVGIDFRTLDIDKLNEERDRRFKDKPVGESNIMPNRSGADQQYREMHAPTSMELKAIDFDCIKRQEESSDEIFWVTQFYKVKNLDDVYDQIDTAIRNKRWENLELDIEWEREHWVSDMAAGIDESSDNIALNHKLGATRIHHGFCPWVCNITCVEQDDAEYDAITEVIDTIDEIAETIAYGASTVASLAGPSPAGAVAGAVASVAGVVSFACDVAGAVVDIVNFFDEDDTIGFVDQQGLHDYAGVPAQTTDPFALTAGRIRGAKYLIRTEYTLAGDDRFNRMWRYQQDTVRGPWQHRDPPGCWGGSGDDITTLRFSRPVNSLIAHGVQDNRERDVRHAEWKAAPVLQDDRQTVRGVVHWGVSWENEIDYRAWASGLRFLVGV